jgi:hypothetical protein
MSNLILIFFIVIYFVFNLFLIEFFFFNFIHGRHNFLQFAFMR